MRFSFFVLFLLSTLSTTFAEDHASKSPIPSDADLTSARQMVEEVFDNKIKAAKTFDEKSNLATELLRVAQATDDLHEKYVLIKQAQDLAIAAKDFALSFNTINALDKTFEIVPLELHTEVIIKLLDKKEDEETLRKLAEIDYVATMNPSQNHDAAKLWYHMARKLRGPLGDSASEQAAIHYQAALPYLTGLEKLRAEKRIADIKKQVKTISKREPVSQSAPKPNLLNDKKVLIGIWAIISVDGPRSLWAFYENGSVNCATWNKDGGTWSLEPDAVKIVWGHDPTKWDKLPRPLDVRGVSGISWAHGTGTYVAKKIDLSKIKILDATYQAGNKKADVTRNVAKAIFSKGYVYIDDKYMGTDPAFGIKKTLVITYQVNGKNIAASFKQLETVYINEDLELKAK